MTRYLRIWLVLAAAVILALGLMSACSTGDDDDDDSSGFNVSGDDDDSSGGGGGSGSGGSTESCEGGVNALVGCDADLQGNTPQGLYDSCVAGEGGAECVAQAYDATNDGASCEQYWANVQSACDL